MRTIRAAHTALKVDLQTDHPFAHRSIYTDGRKVFAVAAAHMADPVLTEVVSRQTFFPRVRERLKPIEYSPSSQLAERWKISPGVVIDPAVAFGQPVVAGTGVATLIVATSYAANRKSAALVEDLFGISEQNVLDAVRFEERHAA